MFQLSTSAFSRSGQRWATLAVALVLLLSSVPSWATGFYKDFVIIDKGQGQAYYQTELANVGAPNADGAQLGSFTSAGTLTLGAEANTFTTNGDEVLPPQLLYRIYKSGTKPGDFAALPLTLNATGLDGNPNNQKWVDVNTKINILAATGGVGDYTLEVFFTGTGTYNNAGGSGSFPFYDSRQSNNYKLYFSVVTPTSVWTGAGSDDNWFTAANWNPAVIPDQNTDVTIPYAAGSAKPTRITYGTAKVRSLTLEGNPDLTQTNAQTLLHSAGELQVFGDFNNPNNNYRQTGLDGINASGVFTLAGSGTQSFDGSSFFEVRVQGGSRKFLRGRMDVLNKLAFVNGGGTLVTRTDNTANFSVDLNTGAVINGEDNVSYVLGVLRKTSTTLSQGESNDFGNIGLKLTAVSGSPGKIVATRITGPQAFTYTGVGTSHSIRRGFVLQPDSPTGNVYDMEFHYLDNELDYAAATGLNDITESNLELFRSINGGIPFDGLSGTVNEAGNYLTRKGITLSLAATFTLGDKTNPLPVTLASFTATATAQGAALRWATASELDNKGFAVERQVAGATSWQQVGYVAGTNAANGSTYSYLDKTLPAGATQVYYRLRQEDNSGKTSYSPVVVINQVGGTELTLSPVPLDNGPLQVAFAEAGQAGSVIEVVNMQGQRVGRYTPAASAQGSVSLPLGNLAPGVYILNVQVPGQAIRHARFVKQ